MGLDPPQPGPDLVPFERPGHTLGSNCLPLNPCLGPKHLTGPGSHRRFLGPMDLIGPILCILSRMRLR